MKNTELKTIVAYALSQLILPTIIIVPLMLFVSENSLLAITSFVSYLITCGILIYINKGKLQENIKAHPVDRRFVLKVVLGALLAGAGVVLSSMVTNYLIATYSPETTTSLNQLALTELLSISPILTSLSIVILGPVAEELVFRQALGNLTKKPVINAIISIVAFTLIHITSLSVSELCVLPSYLTMAIVLYVIYIKSGKDIKVTMSVHILNNLISLIPMFI